MSFLIWNNQSDCQESLVALNNTYGCPYVLPNGYRMDAWDHYIIIDGQWGFFAPESRPGHSEEDLYAVLVPGFLEEG